MSTERRSEIYCTNRVRRALQVLAEQRETTADALADHFLTVAIETDYPELMKAIDEADIAWQAFIKEQKKKIKAALPDEPLS